ncbi:MAG: Omp28-related outer membrane protein [Bacteroidales bacterium]|nr:Omp28-related outer membrane protein [Bacteroidales bacterium]
MKKIVIFAFAGLLSFMVLSTSCDKVDAPYMTIGGGGVVGDTVRKVLLEDFTGHLCVNCAAAHLAIEGLQVVYPKRIIPMVIHVGFFAKPKPAPYDYDFRTSTGDDIAAQFGATAAPLPKGMVNRIDDGGYLLDPADYATAVSLVLDSMPSKPDIFIELSSSFNSTDSTISVDAKMSVFKNMPAGKYNISVMVVESKIVEAQKNTNPNINNGKEILDYEHNDVLRGAINTTWGEEFADAALTDGQVFNKSYSKYKIGSDWKPDDLKIIAFVYYADGPNDKVVIQAEEIHLK